MALLNDDVVQQLKEQFSKLLHPVRLAVFSQALGDTDSEVVKRLVTEMAELDSRLSVEAYNFLLDKEKVEALGIARIPAIAVLGESKDYGIRIYGMPSGYEFATLVDAILDVSSQDSGLSEQTRLALGSVDRPVRIQVFSTPT